MQVGEKEMKEKIITQYINIENILCVFIIMCPILDMVSFIFRNTFHTNFSPSTFLRPIIPMIVIIYLFFKRDRKFKMTTVIIGGIYFLYGIIHLVVIKQELTGSSYSTIWHEAQYIVNYSFMILNLCIYLYVFKESNNIEKIGKSILMASMIYIVSIYVSIVTKTSSSTYIEGMGYKGWFESGNSLGSILILSLFIIMKYVKDKKYKRMVIPIILLEGLFLSILLGTRVGLLGFIIVIVTYMAVETIFTLRKKGKFNLKIIVGGIATITTILLVIITIGSTTLQRRKHLQEIEKNIMDTASNEEAHVTGNILEMKEKIENHLLEKGYMSEAREKSILELYNIANKWNIKNNDQRMQQLIYNMLLIKNQNNIIYLLLGNGYITNFSELVLEMEIPAFLFNFGIIGFILYFIPFASIFLYGVYSMIKYREKIESQYAMYLLGIGFSFVLSFFAGYTFFNSSNMMIIIALNTLLINEIKQYKKMNRL